MHRVTTTTPARGGLIDVNLADTSAWEPTPTPMGRLSLAVALFGDDEAGPFAALFSDKPRDKPMRLAPGHGHGSDSWRVSLKGTLRMGAQRYPEGAFRFQEGGVLYGADDVSWGPEGGYSVVMMGDRRGRAAIAANPADQPGFDAAGEPTTRWLGLAPDADFAAPQGIATTLGRPRNGRIDGSFEDAWPEVEPGVALAAGLAGERERGPLIVMSRAEAGQMAFPALRLGTEVMHVVVRGAARQGGETLPAYAVRLVAAGEAAPAIEAGGEGLWLASVIGDRRAMADAAADAAGAERAAWLKATFGELAAGLA